MRPICFSYHAFAAAHSSSGRTVALRCCIVYGVPMHVALWYMRRYLREGYRV